jgi:glycosyltransferase involved in cell wall biosynthesis
VFRRARFNRDRPLLDRANLIVSNSRFVQRTLRDRARIDTRVVTPFIDTAVRSGPSAQKGTRLTFVGLDHWKGAATALRLADALPERKFLFLEGARARVALTARAKRMSNVTCLAWVGDMGTVFAQTRILLMPSIWEEPFGRLPVEAGAHGIPTIASARGGLPESVGDGGILIRDVDDLSNWVHAVEELDDPEGYEAFATAARRHAADLSLDKTVGRFRELVRSELAIDL